MVTVQTSFRVSLDMAFDGKQMAQKKMKINKEIVGSNVHGKSNHKFATLRRREQITDLLAQGHTGWKIAQILNISHKTAYKLISKINKILRQKIEIHYESYIQRLNIGYNKILSECWDAWERSKVDQNGKSRLPNVLYTDRILATMEALRKLHGLDKITPKEDQNNNTKGALDWDSLVANRSLSSVTVNINGQTPNGSTNNNHPDTVPSTAMVHSGRDNNVPNSNLIVEEFKDAIEDRIDELHRRAEAKAIRDAQQDTTSSLQDATGGQVSQPPPTVKRVIKVKRVTPIKKTIIIQSDSPL